MGWPKLTTVTEAAALEASPLPSRRHEDDTPAVRLQPAEYQAGSGVRGHQLAHAKFHAEAWAQRARQGPGDGRAARGIRHPAAAPQHI